MLHWRFLTFILLTLVFIVPTKYFVDIIIKISDGNLNPSVIFNFFFQCVSYWQIDFLGWLCVNYIFLGWFFFKWCNKFDIHMRRKNKLQVTLWGSFFGQISDHLNNAGVKPIILILQFFLCKEIKGCSLKQ